MSTSGVKYSGPWVASRMKALGKFTDAELAVEISADESAARKWRAKFVAVGLVEVRGFGVKPKVGRTALQWEWRG